MNPLISEIKSRLSIIEAIQKYCSLKLDKKGNKYWCHCLFHHEKTPSMSINPELDRFYCFGCHKSGDQIDLVAEALHIPLSDAIQLLAKDLGLEGVISQKERERIDQERLRRQQEREKREEQENIIKQEYIRLCEIERLMSSFLLSIENPEDLERFEVICSLKNKDLLDSWLDTLLNGSLDEKLQVVAKSKNYNFWEG